jgi:hypothetical protein
VDTLQSQAVTYAHEPWFTNLCSIVLEHVLASMRQHQPERSLWTTDKGLWIVDDIGRAYGSMFVSFYADGSDVVVAINWPGCKARDAATERYRLTKRERMGLAVGVRKPAIKIARYITDTLMREGKWT